MYNGHRVNKNGELVIMPYQKQRGSIVGFIIVGALLALALVGGVFFVKNNATNFNQVAKEVKEDAKDTTEDAKEALDNEAKQNEDKSDKPSDDSKKSDANKQTEAEKKAAEQKKALEQEQQNNASSAAEQTDKPAGIPGASSPAETPQAGVSNTEIPKTGASDILLPVVASGLLVGATIAYRRSGGGLF